MHLLSRAARTLLLTSVCYCVPAQAVRVSPACAGLMQKVAALAAEYDVREAPATLVFTRGPRVAYRVAGYMDRQAVAQAAADAHR